MLLRAKKTVRIERMGRHCQSESDFCSGPAYIWCHLPSALQQ